VGVGLAVEGRYLDVPAAPVQADGLGEGPIGLEPQRSEAELAGLELDRGEHAPTEPEAAHRVGDPHPLDVAYAGRHRLHRSAGDRFSIQAGEEKGARRWDHFGVVVREAPRWIEAGFEAAGQFVEVLHDAPARLLGPWVHALDAYTRCPEESLHLRHRGHQPFALGDGQGGENRFGCLVGAAVDLVELGEPCRGELRPPYSLVVHAAADPDEPPRRE
jgi:hypothetical protein